MYFFYRAIKDFSTLVAVANRGELVMKTPTLLAQQGDCDVFSGAAFVLK